MSKTALITGALGFIGSHLAEKMLKDGWNVIAVDNFDPFYDIDLKIQNSFILTSTPTDAEFTLIDEDICNKVALYESLKECNPDVVIHLAAKAGVRPSIENPEAYVETNINGTVNVLEWVKDRGIKSFIFASSSSVYGNNLAPFSETHNVDNPISPYASTKKAGELICHTYHHLYGINMMMLRFFTVYGPRQRPDLAIHKFTKRIMSGIPIHMYGDGNTRRDYTYIDDIVNGIQKSILLVQSSSKPIYQIFNLGSNRTVKLKYLISQLESILGIKAMIEKHPMQMGDVQETYANISKSKLVLGYEPQMSIEEGLYYFAQWFIQYEKEKTHRL